MTKAAAVKERDEPGLPLGGMKDVTPKPTTAGGHQPPQRKSKPANPPSGGTSGKPKQQSKAVAVSKPRQEVPVIRDDQPVNLLAVLARAAADPNVNPEKMRELRAIQKEIRDDEARISFNEDFIAMQNDLPVINAKGRIEIRAKDSKGDRTGAVQQSTPYATFNEIVRTTKPVLQKHRFAMSYSTDQGTDGRMIVKGFLKHARGHTESTTLSLPLETSGSKNNVQGYGSSLSYGKRYATIALLNIISEAMEDRDTDGVLNTDEERQAEPSNRITLDQSIALVDLINTSGLKIERFLEKYKIKAVIDLNPKLLNEAMQSCRAYAEEKAKQQGKK